MSSQHQNQNQSQPQHTSTYDAPYIQLTYTPGYYYGNDTPTYQPPYQQMPPPLPTYQPLQIPPPPSSYQQTDTETPMPNMDDVDFKDILRRKRQQEIKEVINGSNGKQSNSPYAELKRRKFLRQTAQRLNDQKVRLTNKLMPLAGEFIHNNPEVLNSEIDDTIVRAWLKFLSQQLSSME